MKDVLTAETIKATLSTSLLGGDVYAFRRCHSTNDVARRLAEDGAPEGGLIVAERQTAGRGRRGRGWHSPSSLGLWISVLLRPPIPPQQSCCLSLCASLAVARAISSATTLHPRVKWPNDVLINRRKVAGVLGELGEDRPGRPFAIVGMGINVNHKSDDFPSSLRRRATSLRMEGGRIISRLAFLSHLLQHLESIYLVFRELGWSPFVEEWRRLSSLLGQRVTVAVGREIVQGTVVGLADDGALVVEGEQGEMRRILSGHLLGAES